MYSPNQPTQSTNAYNPAISLDEDNIHTVHTVDTLNTTFSNTLDMPRSSLYNSITHESPRHNTNNQQRTFLIEDQDELLHQFVSQITTKHRKKKTHTKGDSDDEAPVPQSYSVFKKQNEIMKSCSLTNSDAGYVMDHNSDLNIYLAETMKKNPRLRDLMNRKEKTDHIGIGAGTPVSFSPMINDYQNEREISFILRQREAAFYQSFNTNSSHSPRAPKTNSSSQSQLTSHFRDFRRNTSITIDDADSTQLQKLYMIWNTVCLLSLAIVFFLYANPDIKGFGPAVPEVPSDCEAHYKVLGVYEAPSLEVYDSIHAYLGLVITTLYVTLFHSVLWCYCTRYNLSLFVLFYSNIIATMILFYCFVRVQQFTVNHCGYGNIPYEVSIFIAVMAWFGILWTLLPILWYSFSWILKFCFYHYILACQRVCGYYAFFTNKLFKIIVVLSTLGFIAAIIVAAVFLIINQDIYYVLIGIPLLLKVVDILFILCCINGCQIRQIIFLFLASANGETLPPDLVNLHKTEIMGSQFFT